VLADDTLDLPTRVIYEFIELRVLLGLPEQPHYPFILPAQLINLDFNPGIRAFLQVELLVHLLNAPHLTFQTFSFLDTSRHFGLKLETLFAVLLELHGLLRDVRVFRLELLP
jgi:hypothetical protein